MGMFFLCLEAEHCHLESIFSNKSCPAGIGEQLLVVYRNVDTVGTEVANPFFSACLRSMLKSCMQWLDWTKRFLAPTSRGVKLRGKTLFKSCTVKSSLSRFDDVLRDYLQVGPMSRLH